MNELGRFLEPFRFLSPHSALSPKYAPKTKHRSELPVTLPPPPRLTPQFGRGHGVCFWTEKFYKVEATLSILPD